VQQAEEILAQGLSAEILLSNLGCVDLQDTYGPLTLRALWGPAVNTGFAMGQTVGAVTVRSQLHLLHTSCEPATGLLGEVAARLNAALRESPAARRNRHPDNGVDPGTTETESAKLAALR